MGLAAILFVVFVGLLLAGIPYWPHSADWGYGPCGGLAVIGVLLMLDWLR